MQHKQIYREFIDHTEDLLRSYDKQPNPASLRRCVSSAYYSVWHCLCYAWSKKFDVNLQSKLYRQPDHKNAKTAAGSVKGGKSSWLTELSPCCEEMEKFCEDFIRLQEERHLADYDIDKTIPKHEAVAAVERAKRCIGLFESVFNEIENNEIIAMQFDCFLLESLKLKHLDRK